MLPELTFLACPTREWLKNLSPSDIQQGPKRWMKHITEVALVYPGSGNDSSPIRQTNGVFSSFIFVDYGTTKADVLAELTRQRKTGTGFAHHDLVSLVQFDPRPLMAGADPAFIHQAGNIHQTQVPFGIWAVYESNLPDSHERFSFLFLGVEAIQALAALFPNEAPHGLVVQEHGFGGNCWPSFSAPILKLAEHWSNFPEVLILGPNHHMAQWSKLSQQLCVDRAAESMHKETRELLWLNTFDLFSRDR